MLIAQDRLQQTAQGTINILREAFAQIMGSGSGLYITLGFREGSVYRELATHERGDRLKWDYDFDAIAHDKAALTAREGMSTREIHLMQPLRLMMGDGKWWGSVIFDGLYIVAVSGLEEWEDEAVANMIAALWRGILEGDIHKMRRREQHLLGSFGTLHTGVFGPRATLVFEAFEDCC